MDVVAVKLSFDGGGSGKCSWGACAVAPDGTRTTAGGLIAGPCTSQRAELMALLMALRWVDRALVDRHGLEVSGDSLYVIRGATKWIRTWKRRGWKTVSGQPVKHVDLWRAIDTELCLLDLPKLRWVPREMNAYADAAATLALTSGDPTVVRTTIKSPKAGRETLPSKRVPLGSYHVPPDFPGRPFVLVRDGVASLSPDDGGLPRVSDHLLDSEPIRLLAIASSKSWPAYTMGGVERKIDAALSRWLCRNAALRDALGLSERVGG